MSNYRRGERGLIAEWVGQICLIPSKGELFLGQTIIKVEPNKVKWVMEFTPPTFRYGEHKPLKLHGGRWVGNYF